MLQNNLLIPAQLFRPVIRGSLYNNMKVYISAKMLFNSAFRRTVKNLEKLSKVSGLSDRTVRRCLDSLVQMNWIGCHKRTLFIRSIDYVSSIMGCKSRFAVWIQRKDIKHLKAFSYAAVSTELIKEQRVKIYKGAASRREMRLKSKAAPFPIFYPISSNAFAKIVGISKTQATTLRASASKQGYIKLKEDYRTIKTKSPYEYLLSARITKHPDAHRMRIIKGQLIVDLPTKVQSKLTYKKRRKAS